MNKKIITILIIIIFVVAVGMGAIFAVKNSDKDFAVEENSYINKSESGKKTALEKDNIQDKPDGKKREITDNTGGKTISIKNDFIGWETDSSGDVYSGKKNDKAYAWLRTTSTSTSFWTEYDIPADKHLISFSYGVGEADESDSIELFVYEISPTGGTVDEKINELGSPLDYYKINNQRYYKSIKNLAGKGAIESELIDISHWSSKKVLVLFRINNLGGAPVVVELYDIKLSTF